MNFSIYIAFLALGYWIYTGQPVFFIFLMLLYFLVRLILKYLLNPRATSVLFIYDIFYIVYGLLVLISHMELIHNPLEDYYVHMDAARSFYKWILEYAIPSSWDNLLDNTLFLPSFKYYPLAALLMGAWAKLGQLLNIVDLRLFLRLLVFITATIIPVLMANILSENNFNNRRIYSFIVPFGLFTHLYMSSAIFTRDIFLCFTYFLGSYLFLKQQVRFRLILFILLAVLSGGFRPQNGLLFLIYPFFYYYKTLKQKFGSISYFIFAIVLAGLLISLQDSIVSGLSSLDHYNELNTTQNDSGGIFMKMYQLPFPVNTLVMVVYMLLQPLPMFFYVFSDGGTWLNLPIVFSPYLMWPCVLVCLYSIKSMKFFDNVRLLAFVSLLCFSLIVFGSPDLRRAFAAVPGLYICYCLLYDKCLSSNFIRYRNLGWGVIALINVFFVFYVYIR